MPLCKDLLLLGKQFFFLFTELYLSLFKVDFRHYQPLWFLVHRFKQPTTSCLFLVHRLLISLDLTIFGLHPLLEVFCLKLRSQLLQYHQSFGKVLYELMFDLVKLGLLTNPNKGFLECCDWAAPSFGPITHRHRSLMDVKRCRLTFSSCRLA